MRSILSTLKGDCSLWMVHPKTVYMSNFTVRLLTMVKPNNCKLVIECWDSNEIQKMPLNFPGIIFEIHCIECGRRNDYANYTKLTRIRDCHLKRQWVKDFTVTKPSDEGRISGRFLYEGRLETCPWLFYDSEKKEDEQVG